MKTLLHLVGATLAIMITAYLMPKGVKVDGWWVAFVAAIVIGLINLVVRPVLLVLTLPLNIFTLGLFSFLLNGALILLASAVVPGFHVSGLWSAIIFSIVVSLVRMFLFLFIP